MKRIAIFASGRGSNANAIHDYFSDKHIVEITCIVSNKPNAGILENPNFEHTQKIIVDRDSWKNPQSLIEKLTAADIDLIVLAGFLWKIPAVLVTAFPNKIINIHPALLPKYGGKGMYGMHVHEAVLAAGESQSGMTIHYVNEHYDEGATIFQSTCDISDATDAHTIASRVLGLEHQYFARVVEQVLFDK